MIPVAQCSMLCKRYKQTSVGYYCEAFGDKPIPNEIGMNEFDHTKPYPGDNGLRFEPNPDFEGAEKYQKGLFEPEEIDPEDIGKVPAE